MTVRYTVKNPEGRQISFPTLDIAQRYCTRRSLDPATIRRLQAPAPLRKG